MGLTHIQQITEQKKYKVERRHLKKTEFVQIMKNLPIPVSDDEIEEMFAVVDKNGDEKISYREFQKMINPPDLPLLTKPHITQIGLIPQTFSPPSGDFPPEKEASPILPTPGTTSIISFGSMSNTNLSSNTRKSDVSNSSVEV